MELMETSTWGKKLLEYVEKFLMRRFFRRFHTKVSRGRDIRGHMTTSLQVRVAHFVWMEEQQEYCSQVIKVRRQALIYTRHSGPLSSSQWGLKS